VRIYALYKNLGFNFVVEQLSFNQLNFIFNLFVDISFYWIKY